MNGGYFLIATPWLAFRIMRWIVVHCIAEIDIFLSSFKFKSNSNMHVKYDIIEMSYNTVQSWCTGAAACSLLRYWPVYPLSKAVLRKHEPAFKKKLNKSNPSPATALHPEAFYMHSGVVRRFMAYQAHAIQVHCICEMLPFEFYHILMFNEKFYSHQMYVAYQINQLKCCH